MDGVKAEFELGFISISYPWRSAYNDGIAPIPEYAPPSSYVPWDHHVASDPYSIHEDAPELFMDDEDDPSGPIADDSDMPVGLMAQIAVECIKFGKHVSEIFSPKRVTKTAAKIGLNPGSAFDLNEVDPTDGKPWNFNDRNKCEKAFETIKQEKPYLLIGSPPCRAFNSLFQSNVSRMDPAQVKSVVREGVRHVMFCIEL